MTIPGEVRKMLVETVQVRTRQELRVYIGRMISAELKHFGKLRNENMGLEWV
jgi:hypothetical protein